MFNINSPENICNVHILRYIRNSLATREKMCPHTYGKITWYNLHEQYSFGMTNKLLIESLFLPTSIN